MSAGTPVPAHADALLARGARALSARYPVWLCDVWGVVHDGLAAFPEAVDALSRHRAEGGVVVLITNASRPAKAIRPFLDAVGVERRAYDGIVASGDVTRSLVAERGGETIFLIGPERNHPLFDGLEVRFGPLEEAEVAVCTGLFHDETEGPEDYDELLSRMRSRDLDMICANPDKVVSRGKRLVPCAGALAERYSALGGRVLMAGKPFAPIYDEALRLSAALAGRPVAHREVLAIGDGLATDVEGAARNGLALFFIAGGIHEDELGGGDLARAAAAVRRAVPEIELAGVATALRW